MEKEKEQNIQEAQKLQKTFGELLAEFREENSMSSRESAESENIEIGKTKAEQSRKDTSNEMPVKKEVFAEDEDEETDEEEINAEWLELLNGMYF